MLIEEMTWVLSGASLAVRVTLLVYLFVVITLFFYWWPAAAALFVVASSVVGSLGHCISEKERMLEKRA
ncbi:MAG: hypothetical protein LAO05_16385 [Acidobacteriia bacterium]|nr:hypothetical protein [Terriglobia bacterium]